MNLSSFVALTHLNKLSIKLSNRVSKKTLNILNEKASHFFQHSNSSGNHAAHLAAFTQERPAGLQNHRLDTRRVQNKRAPSPRPEVTTAGLQAHQHSKCIKTKGHLLQGQEQSWPRGSSMLKVLQNQKKAPPRPEITTAGLQAHQHSKCCMTKMHLLLTAPIHHIAGLQNQQSNGFNAKVHLIQGHKSPYSQPPETSMPNVFLKKCAFTKALNHRMSSLQQYQCSKYSKTKVHLLQGHSSPHSRPGSNSPHMRPAEQSILKASQNTGAPTPRPRSTKYPSILEEFQNTGAPTQGPDPPHIRPPEQSILNAFQNTGAPTPRP